MFQIQIRSVTEQGEAIRTVYVSSTVETPARAFDSTMIFLAWRLGLGVVWCLCLSKWLRYVPNPSDTLFLMMDPLQVRILSADLVVSSCPLYLNPDGSFGINSKMHIKVEIPSTQSECVNLWMDGLCVETD